MAKASENSNLKLRGGEQNHIEEDDELLRASLDRARRAALKKESNVDTVSQVADFVKKRRSSNHTAPKNGITFTSTSEFSRRIGARIKEEKEERVERLAVSY